MHKELIAPCGMNCGLCLHFLRAKNKCPGCFVGRKINHVCVKCSIKLCKERKGEYCYDCQKFPCERLQRLDKRYRQKYGISEIENLKTIKAKGINCFLAQEEKKWQNAEGTLCVHDQKRYPNKQTLFLSSAGMRFPIVEREFCKLLTKKPEAYKLAFINTAYKFEANSDFAKQDKQRLEELGFELTEIDLSTKTELELEKLFTAIDLIYVEGGNAYVLLDAIRRSGFDRLLKRLLAKGVIYFGVSAGTIVTCPTIEVCQWYKSDQNLPDLKDLAAMNLVPMLISVHYNRPKYQNILAAARQCRYEVRALTDDQAILVRDHKIQLVGEGKEIKLN